MAIPVKLNPFSVLDKIVEALPQNPLTTALDKVFEKLSAKLEESKPVSLQNGVLSFNKSGNYSIEILANGKVKVVFDGGPETVLTKAEWNSVSSFNLKNANAHLDLSVSELGSRIVDGSGFVNLTGVSFTEANAAANSKFEPGQNLDSFISNLLNDHPHDMAFVVSHLTINGNTADAFKLVWDYLDDNYSYYNTAINEASVRLGLEYGKYLDKGGAPLTDVVVKYAADSNGDGIPQRSQSLHDNLLGNFDPASITDKFMDSAHGGSNGGSNGTANNVLGQEMLTLSAQYASRGVFSGEESQSGGARHDGVREFDWDRGWERSDWIDAYVGKADGLATKDTDGDGIDDAMNYGTGNPIDQFSIVRHEGAGVELAIKAKEFGPNGGDYADEAISVDGNGIVHYQVSSGASPDNANRADWSIDYAASVLPSGSDEEFSFKLKVDIDASEGVNLIELPVAPTGDSANIGFAFLKSQIDADPNTAGVQLYNFGEGEFDVVLEAYADGALLAQNHIKVHVVNDAII